MDKLHSIRGQQTKHDKDPLKIRLYYEIIVFLFD